jgi:hypothetical protein
MTLIEIPMYAYEMKRKIETTRHATIVEWYFTYFLIDQEHFKYENIHCHSYVLARKTEKIGPCYSIYRKYNPSDMTTLTSRSNDPSEPSLLARFFYQTVCTKCAPESIRINQVINQQITTDLLYAYDPFGLAVG